MSQDNEKTKAFLLLESLRFGVLLAGDVNYSAILVNLSSKLSTDDPERTKRVSFCTKICLLSFMSFVEGTSYRIRYLINLFSGLLGLDLSQKERAKILELKYDKGQEKILHEVARNSTKKNVTLAFRYLGDVFDSSQLLDTRSRGYEFFLELLQARHRIAHPKTLEDILPIAAGSYLNPAGNWFIDTYFKAVHSCGEKIGISTGSERQPVALPNKISMPTELDLDNAHNFYDEEVGKFGTRTLRFLTIMTEYLNRDLGYALALVRDTLDPTMDSVDKDPTTEQQFARRTLARVLFVTAEGMTSSINFFLKSAQNRNEIKLTTADQEIINNKDNAAPPLHLYQSLQIFSREFGTGFQPKWETRAWRAFDETNKIRDRLAHPKNNSSLLITNQESRSLIEATGALIETLSGLEIKESWGADIHPGTKG